jgi:hypothetical protein
MDFLNKYCGTFLGLTLGLWIIILVFEIHLNNENNNLQHLLAKNISVFLM